MKGRIGTPTQLSKTAPTSPLLDSIASNEAARRMNEKQDIPTDYKGVERKVKRSLRGNGRTMSEKTILEMKSLYEYYYWPRRKIIEYFDITSVTFQNVIYKGSYADLVPTIKHGAEIAENNPRDCK